MLDAENINNIQILYSFIIVYQRHLYTRMLFFVTSLMLLYSIQFAIVGVEIIVNKSVSGHYELLALETLVHSTVIVYLFAYTMSVAAEANDLDVEILKTLKRL